MFNRHYEDKTVNCQNNYVNPIARVQIRIIENTRYVREHKLLLLFLKQSIEKNFFLFHKDVKLKKKKNSRLS